MLARDGKVRVLPLHVANKIAAGEVVERPSSVVKELSENAIDAGAKWIKISISAGGKKLISIQDDGCGMDKEDAVLCLERQATSKILDVDDIEHIDTLGFRGEAIPSIASVSRFTITTRRHDSDEGTAIAVDAGRVASIGPAGCPPGTIVEVKDLFCNVPARKKFLRSAATEESHIRAVFTTHALSHPEIGFSLTVDGREAYRLSPASDPRDRLLDLFGKEFADSLVKIEEVEEGSSAVKVSGFIEKPNLFTPTRREQYIFVNGRSASAPVIAHSLREAYPRRQADVRPAAIIFIELPSGQVDVNVHPAKREVRFRNAAIVKSTIEESITRAIRPKIFTRPQSAIPAEIAVKTDPRPDMPAIKPIETESQPQPQPQPPPAPIQMEFAASADSTSTKPWRYFKFLAQSESGYLLIETDAGIVTVNPVAARERIAYERLLSGMESSNIASQALLIPRTVKFPPVEFSRIKASLETIRTMGFQIEEFGSGTFKIEAVPQLTESLCPVTVLSTIARDLAENSSRRNGSKWRDEIVAKSIARAFAGAPAKFDAASGTKLVEELSCCKMPYVCPRGKPVMIFTSLAELNRKFNLS